jgi:biotin carboxylase
VRRQILFIESNTTGTGYLFFVRALALGLEPILVSKDPQRYPFLSKFSNLQIGDQSVSATLTALDTLKLQRPISIAGVWSSSDQAVELAARLAQRLGSQHSDPNAIALCRDKYSVRRCLSLVGLSKIAHALARDAATAAAFASSIGVPIILKPRSSTGSMGVKLCLTPEEARQHAEALLADENSFGRDGLLAEEFVRGPEYSVELFDGVSIGVTRKHIGAATFIETGHDVPSPGPDELIGAIARHAEEALRTVGYSKGPAHVEIRVDATGPVVIEINPRLAGGMIPELVRRALGVDLIGTSIQYACSMPYDLHCSRQNAASIRFLCRPTPTPIKSVEGLSDARAVSGVVDAGAIEPSFGRGGAIGDYRDRIAYVIAEAVNAEEAGRIAERAVGLLHGVPIPLSQEAANA